MHTWLAPGRLGRVISSVRRAAVSRQTLALGALLIMLAALLPVAYAQTAPATTPAATTAPAAQQTPAPAAEKPAVSTKAPATEPGAEDKLVLPHMKSGSFLNGGITR